MKEKLYRFEVANKGIYEAVDLACPRTDTRRNSKPDGAWLPKVGERFPGAVSYWTEFGLWHYLNSGLYNWHSSVVDGEVTVLVSSRPEKPLYSDEFQVIDLSDKFNVSQNLLPAHLEN